MAIPVSEVYPTPLEVKVLEPITGIEMKKPINLKDLNHDESSKTKENLNCDKCGFNANSLAILVKHKTNEHNPILSCDHCDFKSFKKTDLHIHLKFKH